MNYYLKYIKYKSKYQKEKENQFSKNINTIAIPKSTLWIRSDRDICMYKENTCKDTGKSGIYLANNILISIGMCFEYNELLELGIFYLDKHVIVSNDKYEYRNIHPERYWDANNNFIPNVKIRQDENISHFMCNVNLLKMDKKNNRLKKLLPYKKQNELNKLGLCELFLSTNDVTKIRLIHKFKFNPEIIKNVNDLHKYLKLNDYPYDINKYIEDKILIEFDCY